MCVPHGQYHHMFPMAFQRLDLSFQLHRCGNVVALFWYSCTQEVGNRRREDGTTASSPLREFKLRPSRYDGTDLRPGGFHFPGRRAGVAFRNIHPRTGRNHVK